MLSGLAEYLDVVVLDILGMGFGSGLEREDDILDEVLLHRFWGQGWGRRDRDHLDLSRGVLLKDRKKRVKARRGLRMHREVRTVRIGGKATKKADRNCVEIGYLLQA